MSVEVELFRSDDYVSIGSLQLLPLLRTVFEPLLGRSLEGYQFHLSFHAVGDRRTLSGSPSVVNLRSSHGYVTVRILDGARIVYQHPHPVREIVGAPLQDVLSEHDPNETHWGYGIRAPGLETLALVRPAPDVDNQVDIAVGAGRPRRFQIEEVPDPEPPAVELSDLGIEEGALGPDQPIGVLVDEAVFAELMHRVVFSSEVEEGGFLTGRVNRVQGSPDCYVVTVTAAVQAQRTGASLLQFTFTGESFLRMGDQLDSDGRGDQLVGWYHTHLFAATNELGLSTIDDELHTTTFRQPWQVAGLVNIDGQRRVLRFYHADGSEMASAPYWVGAS